MQTVKYHIKLNYIFHKSYLTYKLFIEILDK